MKETRKMRQESRTIVARKRNKYGGIIDLPYCGEESYLSIIDDDDNDATNSIFGSYYM